jgi:hypothetical protein
MTATVINALAIIAGSLFGLVFSRKITETFKTVIFTGVGFVSLLLGIKMSLEAGNILFLALALVAGGLTGTWLDIEKAILGFGVFLKRKLPGSRQESDDRFSAAFLDSSVLFCVGAMAIIGSFKAGVSGDYSIILTKAVLDGTMAVILTSAMGPGVAFSALSVLVYQGLLTMLSVLISPYIDQELLSEISGTGGILVMMIGLNLLKLKSIKTANFIPALVFICLLVLGSRLFV